MLQYECSSLILASLTSSQSLRARVEVVPLRINTADLPLISNFVQSSINAAIGEYVAPNSMKLDVGEILMGDNIKREVDALGLIVIWIHSASDLEKQDRRGSSDPYCTISYTRQKKGDFLVDLNFGFFSSGTVLTDAFSETLLLSNLSSLCHTSSPRRLES